MAAEPLLPSLVAVTVAESVACPVTSPLPFTDATDDALLAHVIVRPVSALPFASLGVAVSCSVCPRNTVPVAGLTVTVATGTVTAVTVIADEPLLPSEVAVMVAGPPVTPVTRPLLLTVATDVLPLPHVIVRPVSALPLASLGVAVNCTVWPAATDADAGLTVTLATGTVTAVTVIADEPLLPSEVAVIVAEPAATPVTRPLPLTVATDVVPLAHVIVRPVSALPLASWGVAVNCTVWPAATEADAGLTLTEATGTVTALTVRVALPLCPSLVAVMVAEPAATPVARPLASTVAIAELLLAQVTTRPPSAVPQASSGIATNCVVPPSDVVAVAGNTTTDATGAAVAVTMVVALSDRPLAGSFATTLNWPVCPPAL